MMKLLYKKYVPLLFIAVLLFGSNVFSQVPAIQTIVDSNEILIGGQFHLKITANFPADKYRVNWLSVPDSMGHFEVIEKGKPDSTFTNSKLTGITQTLILTSFDSGKWSLPVFKINFDPSTAGTAINLFSDSMPITVSFSATDTTTQLKDIKPVYDVTVPFPIWYWVAGIAGLLLLTGLLFWGWKLLKNRKPKQSPVSRLSAYAAAMKSLAELENSNLTDPVQVKTFHTRTVEIFRKYLGEISAVNQQNKSTGDILVTLSGYALSKDNITKAANSLRCSDAVKFAKYLPEPGTSQEALNSLKEIIELLNKIITAPKITG